MSKPDNPATDYEVLTAYGHDAALAAEIVQEAARGDDWANRWIAYVREVRGQ